jgi:hypothetical protein
VSTLYLCIAIDGMDQQSRTAQHGTEYNRIEHDSVILLVILLFMLAFFTPLELNHVTLNLTAHTLHCPSTRTNCVTMMMIAMSIDTHSMRGMEEDKALEIMRSQRR